MSPYHRSQCDSCPLPPTSCEIFDFLVALFPPHILFLCVCEAFNLWFSVCGLKESPGPATGAACLHVSHGGSGDRWQGPCFCFWHEFCPLTCGIPHWYFIETAPFPGKCFHDGKMTEVFFKVASGLKHMFQRLLRHSDVNTVFIVKTVYECFAVYEQFSTVVSFDSCDILGMNEGVPLWCSG